MQGYVAAASALASVRPDLVPCFNLVLPSLEPPAHTFRALESCWHAGEGLPCCLVTSRGSSGAANGRAGEEYQVRARYQVRANALLRVAEHTPPAHEPTRHHRNYRQGCVAYMLNTRGEEQNTVFYSYLACFVNILTLNTYVFMSHTR